MSCNCKSVLRGGIQRRLELFQKLAACEANETVDLSYDDALWLRDQIIDELRDAFHVGNHPTDSQRFTLPGGGHLTLMPNFASWQLITPKAEAAKAIEDKPDPKLDGLKEELRARARRVVEELARRHEDNGAAYVLACDRLVQLVDKLPGNRAYITLPDHVVEVCLRAVAIFVRA